MMLLLLAGEPITIAVGGVLESTAASLGADVALQLDVGGALEAAAASLDASVVVFEESVDADYIQSPINPSAEVCRLRISNPIEPVVSGTPIIVRYRFRKTETGATVLNFSARLLQGGVEIAEWLHPDIDDSFVTAIQTLTPEQRDLITNFDDLFVEFLADAA